MTLSTEERREIAAELEGARTALASGNEGRARVRARRAAGVALRAHYRDGSDGAWNGDAQSLLARASADPALPPAARDASLRLTTSVTKQASRPFSTDPVGDANAIVSAIVAVIDRAAPRDTDG